MATAEDVLNIVKKQHEMLDQYMERVAGAAEAQRAAYVDSLKRLLEAHEAAEAAYIEGGEALLDHAHRWVEKLDEVSANGTDFLAEFQAFRQDLVRHTDVEVKYTMPKVLAAMDPAQLERVLAAFKQVTEGAEPPAAEQS